MSLPQSTSRGCGLLLAKLDQSHVPGSATKMMMSGEMPSSTITLDYEFSTIIKVAYKEIFVSPKAGKIEWLIIYQKGRVVPFYSSYANFKSIDILGLAIS